MVMDKVKSNLHTTLNYIYILVFDISFKIMVLDHFEDMCMEPFVRGSMWKIYKITHISSYIKY
jgi:hypothetical protein